MAVSSSSSSLLSFPVPNNILGQKDQLDLQRKDLGTYNPTTKKVELSPNEKARQAKLKADEKKKLKENVQGWQNEDGRGTGVTLPDGRTFLGLNEDDISQIAQQTLTKNAQVPGLVGMQEQAMQEAQIRELAKMVGVTSPGMVGDSVKRPIDYGRAITEGIESAVFSGGGAKILGAAAGSGVGLPVVAGATAFGLLKGIRKSIKEQKGESVSIGADSLSKGIENLGALISAAKDDPQNKYEYITLFNEQLAYIERDYGSLKLNTEGYLATLSGATGKPELQEYARFNKYQKELLIQEMLVASAQQ